MWNRLKAVWNQRKVVIIAVLIALLYSTGGGGWTLLRRYCMPLLIIFCVPLDKWYMNVLAFILLSLPLHYGYTEIVDSHNWLAITLMGAIYGASWFPLARKSTIWIAFALALLWPASVYLSHYQGLDWMWLELFIGAGYMTGYLVVARDRKRGK